MAQYAPRMGTPQPAAMPASPAPASAVSPAAQPGFQFYSSTAQTGAEGVDLAVQLNDLRCSERISGAAARQAAGRSCVQLSGVWTDQGFTAETKTVKVMAMSDAYFLLLKKHPELKEVFQLGSRVVWVTPSGVALVIADDGCDKMSDSDVEKLFVAKK